MRKLLFIKLMILSMFLVMPNTSDIAYASIPGSFADLAEELSPAVVNISTRQKIRRTRRNDMDRLFQGMPKSMQRDFQFFFGMPDGRYQQFGNEEESDEEDEIEETKPNSLGSGFVISQDGVIITNHHVIEDADEITITFNDETKLDAKVIGSDEKTDLAVLKVESKEPLEYVKFGDSDEVRVGDWIIAIGNPYGLGGTVTTGIISARARDINAGPYDDFLQTDAAINKGNSGGPMFDMDGEVIGINTAIFSPSGGNVGIGFAIPSNLVQPLIGQIIEKGKISRGWLGVKIQTVTDEIAEGLGLDEAKGALVIEVTESGPAEKAGIEEGDVIIEFNGKEVKTMRKLPRLVAEAGADTDVEVEIYRDGETKTIEVQIGELNKDEAEQEQNSEPKNEEQEESSEEQILGMVLKPLSKKLQEKLGIEGYGLRVVEIDNKSASYYRGIRKGNIIVKANNDRLTKSSDLEKAIAKAKDRDRSSILLLVTDGQDVRFIAVPVEE